MSDTYTNPLRQGLAGGMQLGLGIMYPGSGVIERIGPDWDWIWIDGQHGELGYNDVLAAVRACNLVRRPAVVRVPGHDAGQIGLALDTAAEAVMVPMIDDAEQARQAVKAAKFPPLGDRSYGARRPIDLRGRAYSNPDQDPPLLVCQIETPTALANVAEIAAVDGVDVLFFGPDDISLRHGLAMDQPRPQGYFDEALRLVAASAKACGKIAGGVFPTPEALAVAVELDYRLAVGSADVALLAAGSSAKAQSMRQTLAETQNGSTSAESVY